MKIGGDFEYEEYKSSSKNSLYRYLIEKFPNVQFFLSGRSALYSLLKNIVDENRKISTIYLPGYLCESIYFPIKKAIEELPIKIVFYKQNELFSSDIEEVYNNSVIYILDYFGKTDKIFINKIKSFKEKYLNIILIRDITHSLFSVNNEPEIDYYLCSLRKWTFMPDGAFIASNSHKLCRPTKIADNNFIYARIAASLLKKITYNSKIFEDEYYLSIFSFCEEKLNEYLEDTRISNYTLELLQKIDYKYIINRRRENMEYLLDKIMRFGDFFKIVEVENNLSPFTIPVLFENKKYRDTFRKKMMELGVFLPIHWPVEFQKNVYERIYSYNKNISDRILSFVIDQRYSKEEMEYEANAIRKVIEGG